MLRVGCSVDVGGGSGSPVALPLSPAAGVGALSALKMNFSCRVCGIKGGTDLLFWMARIALSVGII